MGSPSTEDLLCWGAMKRIAVARRDVTRAAVCGGSHGACAVCHQALFGGHVLGQQRIALALASLLAGEGGLAPGVEVDRVVAFVAGKAHGLARLDAE